MIYKQNNKQIVFAFKLLFLMVCFSSVVFSTFSSRAQTLAPEEFSNEFEYEDVIFAVFAGKYRLSSGIFATEKEGRYFLPIVEVADLLGFNADYNDRDDLVSGQIYGPDDLFLINLSSGLVTNNNEEFQISSEDIFISDDVADEIYIEQNLLQRIWNVTFEINPTVLTMSIAATEKLPFEKIIERQRAREQAEQRKQRITGEDRPDVEELNFVQKPYQLFGLPAIDVQGQVGFDAPTSNPEYRLALRGVQDLGYASADYSLAFLERGGRFTAPENLRLRFTRENIHDGALPLNLERVEWGDISLPNRQFISPNTSGRGFTFTTENKNNRRDFDTITVDGVALPGWEAELYLNNALIDFGIVDEDGEYRFEDVLLGFGTSKVRVVLYGPQGEIEEREETLVNRSNKLKQGEYIVSGGLSDTNRDLISLDKNVINGRPEGLTANIYGAYALSDSITAFTSATRLQDRVGNQNVRNYYTSVGFEAALPNARTQVEFLQQRDAGYAVDARAITDFKGFKVNAQVGLYDNFTSLRAGDGPNTLRSEVDLNIRRNFKTPIGGVTAEVGFDDTRRENDTRTTNYTTRQSLNSKLSRLNNTTRTNIFNRSHVRTSGRFDTNNTFGRLLWRNSLNYELFPEVEATSIQTNLRYRYDKDLTTSFIASRDLNNQTTRVSAQITRDFKKFLGTVEGRWQSDAGASVLLRASTSLAPFGYDGSYVANSQLLSQAGAVAAVSFIDKDYDNYYDPDIDEPLNDTVIDVSGRRSEYETDENGYTILPNTTRGQKSYVRISKKSIDDPYLVPGVEAYGIYPRPGVLQYVELPVVDTGAVDGTLTWQDNNKAIKGLVLQLMDRNGDVVSTSKTGNDGYFTFERIPPGDYSLRADPESGFVIPFEYVSVEPDSLFQFGNDIEVVDLSRLSDENITEDEVNQQAMLNVKTMLSLVRQVKQVIEN